MTKKMLISEESRKRIMEFKTSEVSIIDVAKKLKHIECTGEGLKLLITNKLIEVGYSEVKISFIGYEEETNHLMYTIYTNGPMFVIKAQSSKGDVPCLEVSYVQAYDKVN